MSKPDLSAMTPLERQRRALADTVAYLKASGCMPQLTGSFALYLLLGEPVGAPGDVDLAFVSRPAHDRAVELLERERGFMPAGRKTWASEAGSESVNTKLRSPDGVDFDLAFTLGDLDVSFDPTRTVKVDGVAVPIISPEDLRRSYERQAESPEAAAKIAAIDRKRGASPTDAS